MRGRKPFQSSQMLFREPPEVGVNPGPKSHAVVKTGAGSGSIAVIRGMTFNSVQHRSHQKQIAWRPDSDFQRIGQTFCSPQFGAKRENHEQLSSCSRFGTRLSVFRV
jgi:hypothetical protein